MSEGTGVATIARRTRRRQRVERREARLVEPVPAEPTDWPESVRIVGSQPSLWSVQSEPEPAAAKAPPGVVRLGPEALVVGGELALSREIGQSFALMGLMALVLTLLVGLGLLAVRMLV